MRILSSGSRGLLVELEDTMPLVAAITKARPDFLEDFVPGARTVLLTAQANRFVDQMRSWLEAIPMEGGNQPPGGKGRQQEPPVDVPVTYDGEDLPRVAKLIGITVAAFVELHTSVIHTVAFCGFSPGFPYMTGLPESLWLPRLTTPRTRVPGGSVAIAGCYSGIYPRNSPGGWHLIGRTEMMMWCSDRKQPALLTPGTRVRFQPR